MKLSIIIPVYNEKDTILTVLERVRAVDLGPDWEKEIIVVDNCSTDGTRELLREVEAKHNPDLRVIYQPRNMGKGTSIRTAIPYCSGDYTIIQDADLEYDPAEYPRLLAPFASPQVQVVYGSRNLRRNPRSSWTFYWGGRLLSWLVNLLYGARITDEATGYKAFRADLFRSLRWKADGFEFCPEVTARILRRGIRIVEVPISYRPRSREEGKKIHWRDGLVAIWTLVRYRFFAGKQGSGEARE